MVVVVATFTRLVVEGEVPRLAVGGGLDVVLGAGDVEVVPERRARRRMSTLELEAAARSCNGGAHQESADARPHRCPLHKTTPRGNEDCIADDEWGTGTAKPHRGRGADEEERANANALVRGKAQGKGHSFLID